MYKAHEGCTCDAKAYKAPFWERINVTTCIYTRETIFKHINALKENLRYGVQNNDTDEKFYDEVLSFTKIGSYDMESSHPDPQNVIYVTITELRSITEPSHTSADDSSSYLSTKKNALTKVIPKALPEYLIVSQQLSIYRTLNFSTTFKTDSLSRKVSI